MTDPGGIIDTVGPSRRPFPWASVTKLLATMACLVAVEERTLDLDQPAGPAGSTLRHLLSHASGLPYQAGGALIPPGTRRVYSNRGIEVATELLAAESGMSFGEYLHAGILQPLGLHDTRLEGSPASGAVGSLADLLTLGRELLSPTLLSPATLAEATTVAFPGLAGVLPGFGRQEPNDWGLGFELKDAKNPHWTGQRNSPGTFGHFGQSGSFLWVDPSAGVACASLSDTPFGPWAARAWPALSDAVLVDFSRSGRR